MESSNGEYDAESATGSQNQTLEGNIILVIDDDTAILQYPSR